MKLRPSVVVELCFRWPIGPVLCFLFSVSCSFFFSFSAWFACRVVICRVVHPTYIVGGGLLSARVPSLRSVSPLISLFSFLVSLTHDNDARAYTYAISNKHPDFLLTLFDPSSRASLCAVFFSRFLLALVSCVLVDSEGATRICFFTSSPSRCLPVPVPFSLTLGFFFCSRFATLSLVRHVSRLAR